MFKMEYWNKDFSTKHMLQSNPLNDLTMVDGFIVDKSHTQ